MRSSSWADRYVSARSLDCSSPRYLRGDLPSVLRERALLLQQCFAAVLFSSGSSLASDRLPRHPCPLVDSEGRSRGLLYD